MVNGVPELELDKGYICLLRPGSVRQIGKINLYWNVLEDAMCLVSR
jgi:hypothetical protein